MDTNTVAIIPCAGQGIRFGDEKLLALLDDKPVIAHTLITFNSVQSIDDMIVVTRSDLIKPLWHIVKQYKIQKVRTIIEGGKERQDSVYEGIKGMLSEPNIVIIHDGARPLVKKEVVEHAINKLLSSTADGVVVGMPVKDTIKEVAQGDDLIVKKTLNRSSLWIAQTPQIFYYKRLFDTFKRAYEEKFYSTDDSALVEHYGGKIIMVEGSYENIKITTPDDLYQAISLIQSKVI